MPSKSCRHVAQALRLSDFRRALRARESFSCDICAKQADTSQSAEATTAEDARRSWERSAAAQAKHFVGFYAGAKTFWCCPCKHEISDGRAKVEDARRECAEAFDEIAAKQQRRHRNRVVVAPKPALSQEAVPAAEAVDADASNEAAAPRSARKREKEPSKLSKLSKPPTPRPPRSDREQPTPTPTATASAPLPTPTSAAALAPVSSVLGFTNVGNTCYFNAATQALLTVAHYFPEHMHFAETLEAPNCPVLGTFSMLHETIKKKTRRRSVTAAAAAAAASGDPSAAKAKGGRTRRDADRLDGVLTVAPLLKEMRRKFAQFHGSYQQDAHELLLSFLWAIDEEADPLPTSSPALLSSSTASSSSSSSASGADTADLSSSSSSGADTAENAKNGGGGVAMKQIFIKTDTGETVALQVPLSATMAELQQLVAKRLNIAEDDMALSHARPSAVARPSEPTPRSAVSKLNFTRNLFGGELTTVVTCQACGNTSRTVEDAFQLSLPVPSTTSRQLATTDCLRDFLSETELRVAAQNGYDCGKCSRREASTPAAAAVVLRDATMRLVVSRLPRVLVIHLKRLGRLKKVTQHIQFDSMMEMAPFTADGHSNAATCYELVAVVVHLGNKRSGHYVAYVSRSRRRDAQSVAGVDNDSDNVDSSRGYRLPPPQDDSDDDLDPRAEIHTSENPSRSWYFISDTVVKRVALEQVLQCEAYMLFYRQLPPA
ncbi:hypothetical protein PybrP1_007162 [[Pythium] brassicae (nom. inval.)]|nr:hypothetical protein PybrP1_007162 [[Pythium] brassicae (nom. inval.)]